MDKEDNGITKGNSRSAFYSMDFNERNENKRTCEHVLKKNVHAHTYTDHWHPFPFEKVSRQKRQDVT